MTTTSDRPTTDMAARPAFLDGFATVHDAMRRDCGRLAPALARLTDRRHAERVQRWYRRFRAEIEHHHQREDDVLWPALLPRAPEFRAAAPALAEDHEALDARLAALDGALGAVVTGVALDRAHRAATIAEADALATLLVAHLEREEAAAFPAIARTFSAEEFAAIEQQLLKGTSLRLLAFELPWALDGLDAGRRAEALRGVPAPFRLLHRLAFEPAYRRLVAPLTATD
jgi:hypothetical protein